MGDYKVTLEDCTTSDLIYEVIERINKTNGMDFVGDIPLGRVIAGLLTVVVERGKLDHGN